MFFFDFPSHIQSFVNQYWLLINYILLFFLLSLPYITYKKTPLALGILILLFPTYLIRTNIFGVPSTYLELSFLLIFVTWITTSSKLSAISYKTPVLYPIILLAVASAISIFTSPNNILALGIWKAYFIEPILLFFLILQNIKTENDKKIIVWSLGISTLSIALLSIFQKITGLGIAEPAWVDSQHRRVTAFFTSPNAIGLYIAPIAVLYIGDIMNEWRNKKIAIQSIAKILLVILMLSAVFFSKSQGAWIGIITGVIVLVLSSFQKKRIFAALTIFLLILFSLAFMQKFLPIKNFSSPFDRPKATLKILNGSPSANNRIFLWKVSFDYLVASPKNFIFGSGLYGFPKIHEQFRDPKITEPLIYPHNFFLNFWMDTGLLGVASMTALLIIFFYHGLKKKNFLLLASMTALMAHGLIDVPYFKNDLSMLFWTLYSLMFVII